MALTRNVQRRLAHGSNATVLTILVILLVVRPLVSRAFESIPLAATAGERLLADQAAAAAASRSARSRSTAARCSDSTR